MPRSAVESLRQALLQTFFQLRRIRIVRQDEAAVRSESEGETGRVHALIFSSTGRSLRLVYFTIIVTPAGLELLPAATTTGCGPAANPDGTVALTSYSPGHP